MNRLTIQLRQHTPLIHFQHDQAGATLRATEVKPKLDKFILTNLGNGNFNKGVEEAKKNKWLISNTEALDFKLRFTVTEKPDISEINKIKVDRKTGLEKTKTRKEDGREIKDLNSYPLYFGNLDKDIEDNSEYRRFIFLKNPFQMEIFTFQSSLIKEIREKVNFALFFAQNNFGSRQSKGFGSFYIEKGDANYNSIESNYRFTIDMSKHDNWHQLFDTIDIFYKTLRSGINLKNRNRETIFYFKSLLFLYFKNKNIQWDKKSIKEHFLRSDLEKQTRDHNNPDILEFQSKEKKLVKDLLGLSTNESWRSYSKNIEKANDNIDRFKSPITFKPVKTSEKRFTVYIFLNTIDPNFLDQQFEIRDRNKTFHLSTPALFYVNDLFEWILNKENFDITTHVEARFHAHTQFNTLRNIYLQLSDNLNEKNNDK
ncbi:hypothetical protein [Anditalea andensis]|uniref:Uncharacterized protein n=1 Tax=Anditalea andensis TaxID=1048983 RepID=A0A074L0Z3_9BACT|nr:hypothetical protein [Anditalea andensis]KEO75916.1 hypothetical protein EL17_20170 [Anditalea andensis]